MGAALWKRLFLSIYRNLNRAIPRATKAILDERY